MDRAACRLGMILQVCNRKHSKSRLHLHGREMMMMVIVVGNGSEVQRANQSKMIHWFLSFSWIETVDRLFIYSQLASWRTPMERSYIVLYMMEGKLELEFASRNIMWGKKEIKAMISKVFYTTIRCCRSHLPARWCDRHDRHRRHSADDARWLSGCTGCWPPAAHRTLSSTICRT